MICGECLAQVTDDAVGEGPAPCLKVGEIQVRERERERGWERERECERERKRVYLPDGDGRVQGDVDAGGAPHGPECRHEVRGSVDAERERVGAIERVQRYAHLPRIHHCSGEDLAPGALQPTVVNTVGVTTLSVCRYRMRTTPVHPLPHRFASQTRQR